GEYQLLKGVDPDKDQSYFLYMLGQRELAHLLLPLGEYTKKEVRAMAKRLNLPVAGRGESQDLCFVSDGDYRRFLKKHAPEAVRPGPIVDRSGRVIGRHKGLPFYTIGQRGGLGIAASQALYVLRIDVEHNALVVGTADELGQRRLTARKVNFVSSRKPEGLLEVTAKIRRQAAEVPAILTPLSDEEVAIAFQRPLRDITPGQGVVFYREEVVLGGGIIKMAT
ncbi:MAG: tRNA methyl transferase PRC-barrel domain-containing protein, partial [Chloroflexota bacterium]|nr:tRNA methyl transferase PRC-barrel domain-containing protein [Chloroflexota bacterium]